MLDHLGLASSDMVSLVSLGAKHILDMTSRTSLIRLLLTFVLYHSMNSDPQLNSKTLHNLTEALILHPIGEYPAHQVSWSSLRIGPILTSFFYARKQPQALLDSHSSSVSVEQLITEPGRSS